MTQGGGAFPSKYEALADHPASARPPHTIHIAIPQVALSRSPSYFSTSDRYTALTSFLRPSPLPLTSNPAARRIYPEEDSRLLSPVPAGASGAECLN